MGFHREPRAIQYNLVLMSTCLSWHLLIPSKNLQSMTEVEGHINYVSFPYLESSE